MAFSLNKIKALEAKAKRRNQKLDKSDIQLQIPEKWTDFARMVKIRSGGDVKPFNPYPYQEELVRLMLERSVCVVKSRQLGISETIICFMLHRACLSEGYLGLVFSKTQTDSSLLARRMKRMIASLGLKTTTENLSDIEIQGHGRILFRNSRPDSARGLESVCDVFYDEFGFLETSKQVFNAVTPSQQMLGQMARTYIVSTPNGKTGFYWDLLTNGNEGRDIEVICNLASKGSLPPFQHWIDDGGWGKVVIHWRSHPMYGSNPNFLEEIHQKQKLSWMTIEQEYNLSFTSSEVAVFDYSLIQKGADEFLEEEHIRDKKARYYLGIDSSTVGGDYSVAVLLKETFGKYSVVKIYRKRQQTMEFHLYHIGEIIKLFNPEVAAIELTGGVGVTWLEQLSKVFSSTTFEGIRTSGDSKPAMISSLSIALEKKLLTYPANSPLVEELLNFRRIGKKLEAPSGKHDDCVMALCFALTVSPFNQDKKSIFDLSKLRIE